MEGLLAKFFGGLVSSLVKIVEHPLVLFVLFSGFATSAYFTPEHRSISIPICVASACGLLGKIIMAAYKKLRHRYRQEFWSAVDDSMVVASDEIEWGGFIWKMLQSMNYPMITHSAYCVNCRVETHCYENNKGSKVKIKCPTCGFGKSYKGTVNSLLQYVTNQYNLRQRRR